MIPEDEAKAPPFPTPVQAIAFTLFAAFLQGILFLLLITSSEMRVGLFGISAIVAYGFTFAFAAPRLEGEPAHALGILPAPGRAWAAVPFLLFAVLLTSEINNWVLGRFPLPEEATAGPEIEGPLAILEWGAVLILVLPMIEEFFFRGLLQPGLVKKLGPRAGIGLTALLDGIAAGIRLPHLLPEVVLRGMVLGFLRHASGSLLPTLLLGMLMGAVRLMAIHEAFGIPGFDDTSAAHTPFLWLAPACLLVLIGFLLLRRDAQISSAPDATLPPGEL